MSYIRIEEHCAELERCNQRGRRMLSVFDLLEAKTLNLDLASLLMAYISSGASFIVGASPGGAGKTTIMCALLNFIPPNTEICHATPEALADYGPQREDQPCFVCHEISQGPYFSYLWGIPLRQFFSLGDKEVQLATNLHADTLGEAFDQICQQNQVPAYQFFAIDLHIFLSVQRNGFSISRKIQQVHLGGSSDSPELIYEANQGLDLSKVDHETLAHAENCGEFLKKALDGKIRTIEDTREMVFGFLTGR